MRILQAMAGAQYGGAEAFFTRLVTALHRAGLEQRVLIRPNEAREKALAAHGIEPVKVALGGAWDFQSRRAFQREIRDFGPDIVMTWMNRASHFCPKGDFVHIGRLGGYYDLKYYRNCDHLIGNTEDIVQYLVEAGWPRERAHYLPNFVTGKKGTPVSRSALYTPTNTTLILALGRLHPNKAFDTLLQAVARVPNTYLWIAGDGPERAKTRDQAACPVPGLARGHRGFVGDLRCVRLPVASRAARQRGDRSVGASPAGHRRRQPRPGDADRAYGNRRSYPGRRCADHGAGDPVRDRG
jgi:glycosyltransferase involved in cell wall biosynthesis